MTGPTDVELRAAALLLDRWDPIGVGADGLDDEYLTYAIRAVRRLRNGERDDALLHWLAQLERDLGMGTSPEATRADVVAALRLLVEQA